ncbi:MAG: serine/threonine protein kinase [Planctomycetes bacterium]|nr:serine/threonine protein kinase [Planctomycetota bacterium]
MSPGDRTERESALSRGETLAACSICQVPLARGQGESLCPVCRELAATGGFAANGSRAETHDAPARPVPRTSPSLADVPEVLGPFQVLSILGRGSVGLVLKVLDTRSGETAALKILRPEATLDEKARERFLREAKILTLLSHPGIVAATDVGWVGDVPYIAMPYVAGRDLESRVREAGPPPWRRALEWAANVGLALQHAHERKVIHRDIKPSNLLLDSAGEIRILDFGLAAVLDATGIRFTRTVATLGTPYYIPPEQIGRARQADHRADIYSLGATLFFLLTGELPYPEERTFAALCRHILTSPPRSVGAFRDDCPTEIDSLIARAMAKDPESRYADVGEMVRALRAILEGA